MKMSAVLMNDRMKNMNCTDIQNQLDSYLDNDLTANEHRLIDFHINNCSSCKQHLKEAMAVREALKSLPVIGALANFENRVFAEVRKQHTQKTGGGRFISGFATAIAASVFFWVVSTLFFAQQPLLSEQNIITVAINESRSVRLMFDAPSDIQQVTLSLELPENIELEGYPGKPQLSWNTSLKKGQNVLSLPINAIQAGKGELIAQLRYGGKTKIYRLIIKTTDNGVMSYQLQPVTSA